jgi:hypothetical protein
VLVPLGNGLLPQDTTRFIDFENHMSKLPSTAIQVNMSKARAATDQIVKLIVGAGQASPSPPVGPALGSKGVKSMDFCKVHPTLFTRSIDLRTYFPCLIVQSSI